MQRIVHISDLHLGRENRETMHPILTKIKELKPDLVIISGDHTQDGTKKQFIKAKSFIKKIKYKKFIIPGNHDMPFFNYVGRFLTQLKRYKKFINDNPEPIMENDKLLVAGINTARPFFFKQGRISIRRVGEIAEKISLEKPDKIKIAVSHHPLFLPKHFPKKDLVYRWKKALRLLDKCKIDLYLSGHHHSASAISTFKPKGEQPQYKAIAVQAGTAISKRTRREQNSFNYLEVENNKIKIDTYRWKPHILSFELLKSHKFKKQDNGWESA